VQLHAGALNYVTITDLKPSTTYYYKVGDLVSTSSQHARLKE
jgi:hypothetical protein